MKSEALSDSHTNLHDFLSSHESQYGRNGQSVGSYRKCSGIDDKVTTVDVFISDCHAVDSLHIQITTTNNRFVTRFLVDLLNADAKVGMLCAEGIVTLQRKRNYGV